MKSQILSMRKTINLVCLFIVIMGLSSCSMTFEKRHYRKGYHIDIVKNNQRQASVAQNPVKQIGLFDKEIIQSDEESKLPAEKELNPIVSSHKTQKNRPQVSTEKTIKKIKENSDDCDLIILKNGTQIEALVENIGETQLTYRKCNFGTGPIYSVSISSIDVVHLRNGDYFRPNTNTNTGNRTIKTGSGAATNGAGEMVLGILAFVFALFALVMSLIGYSPGAYTLAWVFGSIAFILGVIGTPVSAARMNPDNMSMTVVGLVLGALAVLLAMIILVILVL